MRYGITKTKKGTFIKMPDSDMFGLFAIKKLVRVTSENKLWGIVGMCDKEKTDVNLANDIKEIAITELKRRGVYDYKKRK